MYTQEFFRFFVSSIKFFGWLCFLFGLGFVVVCFALICVYFWRPSFLISILTYSTLVARLPAVSKESIRFLFLHPHQHLFPISLMVAILPAVKGTLTVFYFTFHEWQRNLLATCTSSLENCPFKSLIHLLIKRFGDV